MSLSALSSKFASGEITKEALINAIKEGVKTQTDTEELASRLFFGEDKYYSEAFVKAIKEAIPEISSKISDIFDRELDITNIDLSKTVCNGFSRAFCDMLNILLADCDDFDMALTHGKLGHVYTYVYFKDFHCVYDSILPISDFMNVKLKA